MASLSDQLLVVTILSYLAGMLCYAAEYAFGSQGLIARVANRELVAVGAPSDAGSEDAGPGDAPPSSRAGARFGLAAVIATVVGVVAHAATLVTRSIAAERVPWGNLYEFLLVLCLAGAVAWLVVMRVWPAMRPLGLLLTAVLVVLLGSAGMVYTEAGPLVPALNSAWLRIHVTTVATARGRPAGRLRPGRAVPPARRLRGGADRFPWAPPGQGARGQKPGTCGRSASPRSPSPW